MNKKDRLDLLNQIEKEVVNLKKSPLYQERINQNAFPVIGEGDYSAKIMFIGEAPGKNEARTGKPFCGSAGKVLDELLESIELKRENIYITNIVKDRPPSNRDPSSEEISIYAPFLDRQIDIIQPKIIVALGRFSAQYILTKFGLENEIKPITIIHGKVFVVKTSYGAIKIVPFFHPAAAIYDRKKRDILFEKIKVLKDVNL
ncbi:MAG: uracil-DNA glycosylase [Candidatus Nealsonbacteria bacterium]|nr:uracil-DNA glycosylase [Candidatus Nealsonbacteria bacterium]